MRRFPFPLAVLLALLALLAGPTAPVAHAAERGSTLGPDGAIFTLRTGSYGALFPEGSTTTPDNSVLALDILSAEGAAQRVLVPQSDGAEVESHPFAFFEESSETLYLVWQSSASPGAPVLKLLSFKGGDWGSVVDLRDTGAPSRSAPQVSITHDDYQLPGGPGVRTQPAIFHRTVLHFLWWEDAPAGGQVLYKPVLLINGVYAGSEPLVSLGELDSPLLDPGLSRIAASLVRSPRIDSGRNDHAAIAAFVNPRTGRLLTVECAVVPGELSRLADEVRAHIIGTGAVGSPNLNQLADDLRAHIIGTGARFSPALLNFLGDDLRAHIIGTGINFGGNLPGLAEDARRYLLRSGANVLANGLDRPGIAPARPDTIAILDLVRGNRPPGSTSHQVQLRLTASHAAPVTDEGETTIYSSEDGLKLIIAWRSPAQGGASPTLRYLQATPSGWSDVMTLPLGTELSAGAAGQILQRRVRGH